MILPNVFVVNRSGHDFTSAEKYGDLVYLSIGQQNRFSVTTMLRQFSVPLQGSKPDDFILLTGLSTMNAIACSAFAYLHGRLNLLLFKKNKYIERHLIFEELLEKEDL
jgi:hypothetical protein